MLSFGNAWVRNRKGMNQTKPFTRCKCNAVCCCILFSILLFCFDLVLFCCNLFSIFTFLLCSAYCGDRKVMNQTNLSQGASAMLLFCFVVFCCILFSILLCCFVLHIACIFFFALVKVRTKQTLHKVQVQCCVLLHFV